jgi:hypothetical protein
MDHRFLKVALGGVQATAVDRALAQKAACPLGKLGGRGPPNVATLRALVEGRTELLVPDRAAIAATEALHLPETLHTEGIGARDPRTSLKWGMLPTCGRRPATPPTC